MNIWPVWTDIEDTKFKGGDKGAKATGAYEDIEPSVLPKNIQTMCYEWKRPSELLETLATKSTEELEHFSSFIIVEDETSPNLDIVLPNSQLFLKSELMRWIVCQIYSLWEVQTFITSSSIVGNYDSVPWKPWDHIYPKGKGSNVPTISPNGKYFIKLYWLGTWRKITIDDLLPITAEGSLLLPVTENSRELWLPLLSKAIIKVASLDYDSLHKRDDFGEASIVHMLTGWLPLKLDITRLKNSEEMWQLLKRALPLFKRDSDSVNVSMSDRISDEQLSNCEVNYNTPGKLERIPSDKLAKTKATLATPQVGSKLGKADKPKTNSRLGQPSTKISKGGFNQSVLEDPDPIDQLKDYANLNPEGQLEHPTTALLFGSYSYKQEAIAPLDIKRNLDTEEFFKANKIPPKQPHLLLFKKIRDQPLTPPSPIPCYPKKEYPRYIGYRNRGTNPFDARKPPPVEPKEPRFIEFNSPLSNILEQQLSSDGNRVLNVGLRKSISKSRRNSTSPLKLKSVNQQICNTESNGDSELNKSMLTELNELLIQNNWMEFDDFLNVIDTLYIFYKPDVYPYKEKIESNIEPIRNVLVKSPSITPAVSADTHRKSISPQADRISSEPSFTSYLFVDSIKPIHILFSLSALVNWRLKSSGSMVVKKKTNIKIKYDVTTNNGSNSISTNLATLTQRNIEKEEITYNPDGVLKLIPYEWRQIGEKLPTFILSTSAVNTYQLSLPRGRYVYKLLVSCPLGFVVNIVSHTKFCIGSEESMLEKLLDYSANFNELFSNLINRIFDEIIPGFKEREFQSILESKNDFEKLGTNASTLFKAIFDTLVESLDKGEISNPNFLHCKKFILRLFATIDPHQTIDTSKSYINHLKTSENWLQRTPSTNEHKAAEIIQANYKGYRYRKDVLLFSIGSDEHNEFTSEVVNTMCNLKNNYFNVWKTVLYSLLEKDPQCCSRLNLSQPHEMKIYYKDYSDKIKIEHDKSDWCILFRDVFRISAANFILFHLVCGKDTTGKGRLRVINNDTCLELSSVTGRVVPQILLPNHNGYTVLGYMTNFTQTDTTSECVEWTLRVIGSGEVLPMCDSGNKVNSNFSVIKEVEYYLPNKHFEIFRYILTSSIDTVVTLFLNTSKNSAKFRITIEFQGQVIKEVIGYGNEMVPSLSVTLIKPEQDNGSQDSINSDCSIETDYVIICHVIEDTWPMSESAWKNIDEIRASERAIDDRRSVTPVREGKASKSVSKYKNVQSVSSKMSHPMKPNKENYPHWKLQAILNNEHEKRVKFRKDTRQADELKATKLGWEEMNQGRAERAKETRENFLGSRQIQQESTTLSPEDPKVSSRVPSAISNTAISIQPSESYIKLNPLSPILSKVEFKQVDYSVYTLPVTGPPRLFDGEEKQRRRIQHDLECEQYRQWRVELLERRENERKLRNNLKDNQIKRLERLLVMSNQFHEKVFQPREALRQKYKPEKAPEEVESTPPTNTGRDSKKDKKVKGKK